ncbi:MAG: CoA ester lyase [Candidimonas sp.]|jgi:citrate lyase subunit beta/citryl-CoA lyase
MRHQDRPSHRTEPPCPRSMLFVPGNKPSLFSKVARFDPDAVLFDLEDAVPPGEKADARELVRAAISNMRGTRQLPYARINAPSEGGFEDVSSLIVPGLRGLVIPKVERAEELILLDRAVSYQEGKQGIPLGTIRFLPLPETARGIQSGDALAAATDRVSGLVGVLNESVAGDVARALGLHPTTHGAEQSYICSKVVLDSKAGGALRPMASLIGMRLDDLATVRKLAERARSFGYAGALVIHPAHIAVVHEVFSLSGEEIEFFASMVDAFAAASASGDGAISFRGNMVDIAMARYAQDQLDAYGGKCGATPRE